MSGVEIIEIMRVGEVSMRSRMIDSEGVRWSVCDGHLHVENRSEYIGVWSPGSWASIRRLDNGND